MRGPRPANEKSPDRVVFDYLATWDGPLLKGLDLTPWKAQATSSKFGLSRSAFGHHPQGQPLDEASLAGSTDATIELRLPACCSAIGSLWSTGVSTAMGQTRRRGVSAADRRPAPRSHWNGKNPVVTAKAVTAYKQLLERLRGIPRLLPQVICYPRIVPEDEVVCLKLYHREDQHLVRLFLDDEQTRRLERLWQEHRFVTQWPIVEHKNLPLFIGFVTQDQPKELVVYFQGLVEPFRIRAETFGEGVEAAAPKQLEKLLEFAARAYRRPLVDKEKAELLALYQTLPHEGRSS